MTDQRRWSIDMAELSDDEVQAIKTKIKALDKYFGNKVVAKYKLDVMFGKERSTWKPCAGAISIYTSGGKLNGGGDEKLYICPRPDCGGVIPPIRRFVKETKEGKAVACVPCPACGVLWPEEELIGEILCRLTPQDWALAILRMFSKLEHNADIYLKYHPTDIRYQTAMEAARAQGGEAINKARENRGMHIYPLKNIIKDTGAGAQLYDRILAFIRA
jgi:hypothetical protein